MPRILAKWLLMWSDIMAKEDFPMRGILRNEAREMTACSTLSENDTFYFCDVKALFPDATTFL